jgi:SSS family solute:Na+ symporter
MKIPIALACLFPMATAWGASQHPTDLFRWSRLPDLPLAISGQSGGVSHGALLVVGGSYFPVSPFEGGKKVWVDAVYVLEPGSERWLTFRLDRPLAYAAGVTAQGGVVVIGGGDASRNFREAFVLRWRNGRLERTELPALPKPAANGSAAVAGSTVYFAGGQETPTARAALRNFWSLDLSQPGGSWKEREPWPGPGRIFPVLAAQDGSVYLFSGAELLAASDGPPVRRYLADAYRYTPGKGWTALPDCPRPMVAAPALAYGQSHILVFGGDDGAHAARVQELKDRHPGFRRDILAFHTITRTWARMGTLQDALVTTPAVLWRGGVVIPGGEDRPGRRSASVLRAEPAESRAGFKLADYTVLAVYLAGIVLMGVYLTSRNRNTGEFFLGGRSVPWWAAGLSIYGTQLSSITFMAIPAKAYATDWTYVLINACILLVAPLVVFFYMPFFHRLNITTAYEYLEKRFNRVVRLFCSALFILFQLGRLAVVLFLPAIALATVSDMNIYLCILLMGLLAIAYTMMGGIQAVVWTDVVQSIVLLGGAVICLALAVAGADGGFSGLLSVAQRDAKLRIFDWTWDLTTATVWVLLVGNLASVLATYTTDQTVIQKYLTTPDVKRAARSIWTNALLTIPSTVIFFGIGTALYAYYLSHPEQLNPHLPTDAIFPWFMVQRLPVGIAGLLVAALFAAAQSTLSSSMHSMATALIVDFYQPFRGSSPDQTRLRLARLLTCLLGLLGTGGALAMATYNIRSLFDFFLTLLSLLGGSLAGIFALGIFTRRASGWGALAGGLASAAIVLLVRSFTQVHFFLYAPIGMLSCLALGYGASLILRGPQRELSGLTIHTAARR